MDDDEYDGRLNVVLVGAPAVGKSWIVSQLLKEDQFPTQAGGVDFKIYEIRGESKKRYRMILWDLNFYLRFKGSEMFARNAALLVVLDITDKHSLYGILDEWMEYILSKVNHVPIIVVGNKCDCIDEREISSDRVRIICDEIGIQYIEVSAKENINIDYLFRELVKSAEQIDGFIKK